MDAIKNHNSIRRKPSSSAFTLIELFLCCALISILAGMLLPGLSRSKRKAADIKCLSNARQLGIGVMLYVADHHEQFPPSADYSAPTEFPDRIWTVKLFNYVSSGGVYLCSSVRGSTFASNWTTRGHSSVGYTTATGFDPKSIEGFPEITLVGMISDPALTPLFADTPSGPTVDKYRGFTFDPYNFEVLEAFR